MTSLSRRTLTYVREYLVSTGVLRSIHDLFRGEGFNERPHAEPVEGQRRNLVESYYASVDWSSPPDVERILKVLQALLSDMGKSGADDAREEWLNLLKRDGFELDGRGRLHPTGEHLVPVSNVDLGDDATVQLYVGRMREAAHTDPEAAIGAAKELIEGALKYVLEELGAQLSGKEDVPDLVKKVHSALDLHAGSVAPTAKGVESVKRVLSGLTSVAVGMAELRNQYGTGHGRARRLSGLAERHARLAVNAASTYVDFLLSTFKDPHAPWRTDKR